MNLKETIKKFFYRLQQWVNQQSMPARVGVQLGVLLVIFLLWLSFAYMPVHQRESFYLDELASADNLIETTNNDLNTIMQQLSGSSHQERQMELSKEAQEAEKYLSVLEGEIIPSDEMSTVLRDVLLKEHDLALKDFHVFPKQTLVATKASKDKAQEILLYEQNVQMTFSGDYFAVLKYLQHLEKLEWRFFWDEITYKVNNYPTATVTVKLHTLGQGNGKD